jgi:hypothetical protein
MPAQSTSTPNLLPVSHRHPEMADERGAERLSSPPFGATELLGRAPASGYVLARQRLTLRLVAGGARRRGSQSKAPTSTSQHHGAVRGVSARCPGTNCQAGRGRDKRRTSAPFRPPRATAWWPPSPPSGGAAQTPDAMPSSCKDQSSAAEGHAPNQIRAGSGEPASRGHEADLQPGCGDRSCAGPGNGRGEDYAASSGVASPPGPRRPRTPRRTRRRRPGQPQGPPAHRQPAGLLAARQRRHWPAGPVPSRPPDVKRTRALRAQAARGHLPRVASMQSSCDQAACQSMSSVASQPC